LLAPLETAAPLATVHAEVRRHVPTLDADRPPAPDVATIDGLIARGAIEHAAGVRVK